MEKPPRQCKGSREFHRSLHIGWVGVSMIRDMTFSDLRRLATVITISAALSSVFACGGQAPEPSPSSAAGSSSTTQVDSSITQTDSERAVAPIAEPGPCTNNEPLRNAFFGDLHIHTAWSMDAYTSDVRADPNDAYRFARGESIALAGNRTATLERPLDFAAVTDHAEFIGEVSLCTDANSPAYTTRDCRIFRGEIPVPGGRSGRMSALSDLLEPPVWVGNMPLMGTPYRSASICDLDPATRPTTAGAIESRCGDAAQNIWELEELAAERWNDATPECRFTTFHAYEYSLTPQLSKIHRNVVFANTITPKRPTSWIDEPEPVGLWNALREQCLDAGTGCDVIAIPHNSNLSNGRMFEVDYREEPLEVQIALANLRARVETLVEIMQVKGESECRNGMYGVGGGADELCGFEKFRGPEIEDCGEGTGVGALGGLGCTSRTDYVRYTLIEGLREADRIGVNPFKLGIIASTDTHNATPGDTEEASYDGAHGIGEDTAEKRLASKGEIVAPVRANPGGLIGVWAEENSRESLFAGMKRRETFGTSGTRMKPRLFGGWDYPEDLCSAGDVVATGYAQGVPMGQDLPIGDRPGASPVFVATALRDPGAHPAVPGNRLERIQIVKGWVDDDGGFQQAVHDIAGAKISEASVDPDTCGPSPEGSETLCAVWRDPDFDPNRRAVYYARVLESPSCRWTTRQCLELAASELGADHLPNGCSDPAVPKIIRERAWTWPIWYTPGT